MCGAIHSPTTRARPPLNIDCSGLKTRSICFHTTPINLRLTSPPPSFPQPLGPPETGSHPHHGLGPNDVHCRIGSDSVPVLSERDEFRRPGQVSDRPTDRRRRRLMRRVQALYKNEPHSSLPHTRTHTERASTSPTCPFTMRRATSSCCRRNSRPSTS